MSTVLSAASERLQLARQQSEAERQQQALVRQVEVRALQERVGALVRWGEGIFVFCHGWVGSGLYPLGLGTLDIAQNAAFSPTSGQLASSRV